jgi:hypothetical protein
MSTTEFGGNLSSRLKEGERPKLLFGLPKKHGLFHQEKRNWFQKMKVREL